MTITTPIAYLLIAAYLLLERWLRKGAQALRLSPGPSDRGSSYVLWIAGLLNFCVFSIAPVLNQHRIASAQDYRTVGWLGIGLMLLGLGIRYSAAKTLGEFYTRTLQTFEEHRLVDSGLYRFLRHPGYLGTLLIAVGAGMAMCNWIALAIVAITELISKLYRIWAEEKMLQAAFGLAYANYANNTWRLIPFLY